jgi:hypothetical protein
MSANSVNQRRCLMKKNKLMKIAVLILGVGLVFAAATNLWAYHIDYSITDSGSGLALNLGVDTAAQADGLTLYSYQFANVGPTIVSSFTLAFLLGIETGGSPPYTQPVAGSDSSAIQIFTAYTPVDEDMAWTVTWLFSGSPVGSGGTSPLMTVLSSFAPDEVGDPFGIVAPGFNGMIQVEGPGYYATINGGTREPVPEPATLLLLGSSLLFGGFKLRRKKM